MGMKNEAKKKSGFARFYKICPVRHSLGILAALVIVLHLSTRNNYGFTNSLWKGFVRPLHRHLSVFCSRFPFSVAELLIAMLAAGLLAFLIYSLFKLRKPGERWKRIYRLFQTLLCTGLLIYGGFCLLWGTYYYGSSFVDSAGLSDEPVSLEELTAVTKYFAGLSNEYGEKVRRDENGFYSPDRREILEKSKELYLETEKEIPCLEGPDICPKGIFFSRVMSYIDFTGFFFPFTGEANVNMDFPPPLFASTVAHELAHQRGAAREQDANFIAVMASLNYGDRDFCYSAALLAYTHLGNALRKADYAAWEEIYDSLSENVLRDFALDRYYWRQFETPVQKVSNTVYEGFLQSYGQELGRRSYGACVDLLVNYYCDEAAEAELN
ncbi:MAG: DUF3810 domain-containing protein [Candidatus Limivicinus sp.]|jgi:hypothetical protein